MRGHIDSRSSRAPVATRRSTQFCADLDKSKTGLVGRLKPQPNANIAAGHAQGAELRLAAQARGVLHAQANK